MDIVFFIFALLTVFMAFIVVFTRHMVYSAVALVCCFLFSVPLWLMTGAEFLSLILLVVYVGAVMVLFLFVVMMLDNAQVHHPGETVRLWPFAAVVLILSCLMLILLISHSSLASQLPLWYFVPLQQLGALMYSDYIFPVELAAVLLLTAMVCSIALVHRREPASSLRKKQNIARQIAVKSKNQMHLVDGEQALFPNQKEG